MRGSSLASRAHVSTESARLTHMMQVVSQVGPTRSYSKPHSRPSSRIEMSLLLRAISAADWIAADYRDEGDDAAARYYECVANDLRGLAQARGVTC
jgi:hypothetical protein